MKQRVLNLVSNTEVAEILEKAAEIIDEFGWIQGQGGHEAVGYCAAGALHRATRCSNSHALRSAWPSWMCMDIHEVVTDHLAREGGWSTQCNDELSGGRSLVLYNDTPGRTAADVTTAFRKTALTLREQA